MKRVPNADLSSIDRFIVCVLTNSDCNTVDFVWSQQVQSPPWNCFIICGAAWPLAYAGSWISINGFVSTAISNHTRLSGYSFLCNVPFCAVSHYNYYITHYLNKVRKCNMYNHNYQVEQEFLKADQWPLPHTGLSIDFFQELQHLCSGLPFHCNWRFLSTQEQGLRWQHI